jgi:transcriptional regulator with XRE-family HTH domain
MKGGETQMLQITLRAARVNAGLLQKDAAKIFGIHYETLGNYEGDSTNVPRSFFIRLEEVYGIPTEHIYFGKQTDYWAKLKQRDTLQNA